MIILSLLLALSISSEKIDTFMHLPDWFPTAVGSEHTFGSADHLNATHRTTLDTLAAVESVFDAYHERVFYASDSFAPDWDRGIYGPKPAEGLQTVWFTNTLVSAPGCFVYSSWTNSWPRAAPESRRLLEFANVFALAKWLPDLFGMRTGTPWLDKGETWGTDRTVMFASSWGPGKKSVPDDVPWTEARPLGPDEVDFDSMIPLCYCTNDAVFVTAGIDGKDYGLVYRMLSSVDRTFNALGYGVTNAAGETVKRGGILGEWDTVGFSNSLARTTTVPGIIMNHFPSADPEYGMTNLTRRLVPDDYRGNMLSVESNKWKEVLHVTKKFSVSEDTGFAFYSPRGSYDTLDIQPVYGVPVTYGAYASTVMYTEGRVWAVLHATVSLESPYDGSSLSQDHSGYPYSIPNFYEPVDRRPDFVKVIFDGPREGTVDFSVFQHVGYLGGSNYQYRTEGWAPDQLSATLVASNLVVSTNYANASSLLATESRALAMLDRTYELGPFLTTNGPRKAEVTRYRADAKHEMKIPITIKSFSGPPFVIDPIITLGDISLGTPEYQKSNSVEEVVEDAPFTREFARFSGEAATGGLLVNGLVEDDVPVLVVTAGELLDVYGGWIEEGAYLVHWEDAKVSSRGGKLVAEVSSILVSSTLGRRYSYVFSNDATDSVRDGLKLTANASVTKTAWYAVSDRLSREYYEHEKNLSRVAPGPQGFRDGRVSKSVVELFSGLLFMCSYVDPEQGPLDSHWFPGMYCASLPTMRPEDDEDLDDHPPVPFVFEPYFRICGEGFTSHSSVPGKLYAARDDVRSRAILRLSREVVGSGGSMSSAVDVVPIRSAESVFKPWAIAGVSLVDRHMLSNVAVERSDRVPDGIAVLDPNTGNVIPNDEPVARIWVGAAPWPSSSADIDKTKLHPAVAVDGRVEPVIVTDWSWEALKSSH